MNIEETAKKKLQDGKISCLIVQSGEIVYEADGRGVSPLMRVLQEQPALLKDAAVFDKIIGKAAAMIVVLGGCKSAYGEKMSDAAYDYLCAHKVEAQYGTRIPMIINRAGTGLCPLESSVLEIDDPTLGYARLLETIKSLQAKKQTDGD